LKILRGICRIFRQEVLLLGTFGRNFLDAELRFDQNFYVQANVPFSTRWNSLTVSATPCPALRHALGINNEKYIFVHEDRTRGYTINPNRLPKGVKIVKPLMPSKKWDFCDYIEVIQGATEIHVIESSFAALVETLGIDGIPKFAHRYARPNAFYDARYEFTYKSDWKILL
jgi:hypothetical protein